MTLYLRGDSNVWTAQWRWGGKKFCRSTGMTNKKLATRIAARFLEAQKQGRVDILEASKLRRTLPSIAQVIALYRQHSTCRPRVTSVTLMYFRTALRWTNIPEDASVARLDASFPEKYAAAARAHGWSDGGISSALRQCRAIFKRALLPKYGMDAPPEWLSVQNLRAPPIPGFQKIPWSAWVKIVRAVHALNDSPIYRAFVLMCRCGLGNDEVIHARGTWLIESGAIRIEPRDGWLPKSLNRHRTVPMRHSRFARHFAQFLGKDVLLVPDGNRRIYRRLNPIIRDALPGRQKASYELRKLAGSVIATRDGMYAAGKFLGNRSSICERHYATLLKPLLAI